MRQQVIVASELPLRPEAFCFQGCISEETDTPHKKWLLHDFTVFQLSTDPHQSNHAEVIAGNCTGRKGTDIHESTEALVMHRSGKSTA